MSQRDIFRDVTAGFPEVEFRLGGPRLRHLALLMDHHCEIRVNFGFRLPGLRLAYWLILEHSSTNPGEGDVVFTVIGQGTFPYSKTITSKMDWTKYVFMALY